jgi:hypothetical protein
MKPTVSQFVFWLLIPTRARRLVIRQPGHGIGEGRWTLA